MNKVSRITALGIGLTAAFFVSCKKVNAVSIKFSDTLVLNPVNGSVFEIQQAANSVTVNGSLNGKLNIALVWDDKDLIGKYIIGAKAILSHDTKKKETETDFLEFARTEAGIGYTSQFQTCSRCVPEVIQSSFGIGDYATSYNLSVVFTAVPENSPSGAAGSIDGCDLHMIPSQIREILA